VTTALSWRPDAVDSADLAAGMKAAKELNALPVPLWLSKQLANYIVKSERELETRKGRCVVDAGATPSTTKRD
jgi:hypothetical protein